MEASKMILCDTNIIIELYKGNDSIIKELKHIGQDKLSINTVTAGELIFGAFNKSELLKIKKDIYALNVIPLDHTISNKAIELMINYSLSHKLNLPDALIAATSIVLKMPLFTLNTKDFKYISEITLYKFKIH